ncbi:MAG: peptidylprolyl isomerase [Marinosulfonomonas sp.]|nr:peptidylprolyl isomerase [Marinosulfonomonas sp.]
MLKRTITATIFAAAIAGFAPASAQETATSTTADTVVATVNGTDITIGHMIVMRGSLPEQYQQLTDEALFEGLLDQMVQQTVLAQTLSEPTLGMALRQENELRAMMAGEVLNNALKDVVSDEALQAAFDGRYADAPETLEFDASHILVATEEEALALIEELNGGADFADLAKEKSTGPSGAGGGGLGWFGPGMMVEPFETAVTGMEPGAISAPVKTQFGWHIIKLNETRTASGPTLDEVRQELSDEIQQKAFADILADMTAKADIGRPDISAIDPAVLRQVDLIQN